LLYESKLYKILQGGGVHTAHLLNCPHQMFSCCFRGLLCLLPHTLKHYLLCSSYSSACNPSNNRSGHSQR
jgi:hypothetical protein